MTDRKPLNIELSPPDRLMLAGLLVFWKCSMAEAIRRMIRNTSQHVTHQEFVCPDGRPCSCPQFIPKRPLEPPAHPPGSAAAGSAG